VTWESGRLERFIRRRVADVSDSEDILQEVLFEFVEATLLMRPIERIGAWLFRVARNRIVDRLRKKRSDVSISEPAGVADGQPLLFEDVLLDELEAALDELRAEQRAGVRSRIRRACRPGQWIRA
jgi:RNA polymerase sigma factor (sigma-70 family)